MAGAAAERHGVNTEEPIVIVTERTRLHLLTVVEFAEVIRVNPLTVYKLIKEKPLRGVIRIGRHIRINPVVALADLSDPFP